MQQEPRFDLDEAKQLTERLASLLPAEVRAETFSWRSKLSFKVDCIRSLLAYRILELSELACDLYATRRTVGAILLTRAAMEACAWLLVLRDRVDAAVRESHFGDIDDFLMRLLFGARSESSEYSALNVLGAIQRVDREIPRFLEMYELFSEVAHPNYAGVMSSFGNLQPDQRILKFDRLAHQLDPQAGVPILGGLLELSMWAWHDLSEQLPAFAALSDRDLAAGAA